MNKLESFVSRCLRRILNIRWPDTILDNSLWEITKQEPIDIEIKRRKWRWIGHTLRKPAGDIEKDVLDWKPQGARRRRRPRKTWRRTIEEKITEMGKRRRQVKALANQRRTWRRFTGAIRMFQSELEKLSQVKS
jgi:hypothetical protein